MLDIIEFSAGVASVICFFAWLFMLIMEMTAAAGDRMPESTRSWEFATIGPILFFCWMSTMCLYFVVQGLPR